MMNTAEKQIETINNVINSTKENLKPLSINFIFWGIYVNILSGFHYAFPSLVQSSKYSAAIYWIILSIIGMLFMACLLYTSPSPRDMRRSRMPSSA